MKIFKLFTLFFIAIIFIHCAKEDNSSNDENSMVSKSYSQKSSGKLEDMIILKDFKDKFSLMSLDLGVTKIQAEKKDDEYHFLITRDISILNNVNLDVLNELVIFEKDDMIITKFAESKNYIASRSHNGKSPLLFFNGKMTEYKSGDFNKLEPKDQLEFVNLLIIRDEIINPDLELYPPVLVPLKEKTCNWVATQIESDRELLKIEIEKTTISFLKGHPDCKRLGGVSSGCLWEDFGCVATQRFECSGKTCDWI